MRPPPSIKPPFFMHKASTPSTIPNWTILLHHMMQFRHLAARASFREMQKREAPTVLMFILPRASQSKPFNSIIPKTLQHAVARLLHTRLLKALFVTTVWRTLFPIPSTSLNIVKHPLSHTLILARVTALAKPN